MRIKLATIMGFALALGILLLPVFLYAQTSVSNDEVTALNSEIAARKETIKQLEASMEKTKNEIDKSHTEVISLKNVITTLANHITRLTKEAELTEEKIKQAELEIQALELTIKDKQAIILRQKSIISKIIQNINANDQQNYVEILLTNDNFSDFFNQVKYLEDVYSDLGKTVKNVRLAKEDLDSKKVQVEARKKTYEDLKIELDNKQIDLNEQNAYKQTLLIDTQNKEARFKTQLQLQKGQAQAIENEVRNYEVQVRKKLEQANKISEEGTTQISWPLSSHYITATFHDPGYPFRKVMEHSGIDIRASQGTPIRAAASGYIARAKRCTLSSCYSYILLVHSGNLSTLYGHMSTISISDEQFINKGDIIGYSGGKPGTVGAGPFVTGPHLHFEVRANGIPVNPMNYLIQ